MGKTQKYGIKFPFENSNDEGFFVDLNPTYTEDIKSQVLHVIFTPKGQRLRMPDFGTDLLKYVFGQADEAEFDRVKNEITRQILKYVPDVEFKDVNIYKEDKSNGNGIIVVVEYGIKRGNKTEYTSVGVKL